MNGRGKIHALPGEFNFHGVGQSIAVLNDDAWQPKRIELRVIDNEPILLFGANEPLYGPGSLVYENHLYAFACDLPFLQKARSIERALASALIERYAKQYHLLADYQPLR